MATLPTKIAVAVPAHDQVDALFAYDLAQMMSLTAGVLPEGVNLGMYFVTGTYIHKARTELLEAVIEDGASHVLWLDSDMRFPRDTLIRLLQHQQPVVGVNYSKRRIPAEYVAIKHVPDPDDPEDEGIICHTTAESTGLEEVDALGFGAVLMELDQLRGALPDPKIEPWFWYEALPNGMQMGEDVYFCTRMLRERLGMRIFVDHDLSWQCAHIGRFEFKCAHAETEESELQDLRRRIIEGQDEDIVHVEDQQVEVVSG